MRSLARSAGQLETVTPSLPIRALHEGAIESQQRSDFDDTHAMAANSAKEYILAYARAERDLRDSERSCSADASSSARYPSAAAHARARAPTEGPLPDGLGLNRQLRKACLARRARSAAGVGTAYDASSMSGGSTCVHAHALICRIRSRGHISPSFCLMLGCAARCPAMAPLRSTSSLARGLAIRVWPAHVRPCMP